MVLMAMSRALKSTEDEFLDMTNKALDSNPELALVGSCLLVVLMRGEEVYVMNVGDSRATVAQHQQQQQQQQEPGPSPVGERKVSLVRRTRLLTAMQLSTDHTTSSKEEVAIIKDLHQDDCRAIVNGKVKTFLKVTRAFGAGFLKEPKLHAAGLKNPREEFIGTTPYIHCAPSMCHYTICGREQFIILASDGLFHYMSNKRVVTELQNTLASVHSNPAERVLASLIEAVASEIGLLFDAFISLPEESRKNHIGDIAVVVISLEGKMWKCSLQQACRRVARST